MKITKLILPVAGLGKRLRPLTFRTPKSLILVKGLPMVEYVLEEARASGIREVILIINPKHKAHFREYVRKNQRRFPFKFHIRVQEIPGGNGHALLPAGDIIGNEPFAVRFCDDIIIAEEPVLKSLLNLFKFYKSSAILLERIPKNLVSRYGVVGVKNVNRRPPDIKGKIYEITKVIEKPPLKNAPSNLIVVGGYVLTPSVFRNIKKVAEALPQIAADALPINVGLQIELIIGGKIYGWEFNGRRLDCGTLESFRKTEEILSRQKFI